MAQRLQVAKMLHEGHVFHEIVEETGASTATISRVNRAIKDGCDGYQIIFDRTEKTEEKYWIRPCPAWHGYQIGNQKISRYAVTGKQLRQDGNKFAERNV